MDLGFPLPEDHLPEGRVCVQFEIPDDQTYAADVIGHIMQLGKWWNWEKGGGDDRRATETAQLFRKAIHETLCVEKYRPMGCNCPDSSTYIYTYDEDGNLQVSTDGGTTSEPAPLDDIRLNPKVVFPPVTSETGTDAKCSAADSMTKILKEQIGDQLTDDMSRYTLSQLINDWTKTMIGTSNPFEALVTVITNQIFALVIATVRAAITSGTYDTLNCIFYCNMESDGSFTEAEWTTVRSQILSQITGIAGVFFEHLIYLIGSGGLTNMARAAAGATDADCSDCCPDCSTNWNLMDGSHGIILGRGSEYIDLQGQAIGGNVYGIISTGDAAICCQVVLIQGLDSEGNPDPEIAIPSFTGWTDCGTAPVIGVPQHSGILGGCINYLQLQDAGAFKVRITFAPC